MSESRPDRHCVTLGRRLRLFVATCAVLSVVTTAVAQTTDDFRELDNIQGPWINLNHVPIRPMVIEGDGSFYAVNTHDSTVVHFTGPTSQPSQSFRVPWSPVSLALWSDPSAATDPKRIVVVCRGSYGLAILKASSGETVAFIPLPAEPGDIALIGNDAWVSCSGADQVVRVDLTTETITASVPIQAEHPLFLTVDGSDVLVTPQFSGNNTVVDKTNQARDRTADRRGILDLDDSAIAVTSLPDHDVIRISGGTITQTIRGVGTILFGHGINPVSGELWVLNTAANNLGKLDSHYPPATTDHNLLQSEPSIRGFTVRNRISRVDLAAGTVAPIELELDASSSYDDARTIGQPYALDFVPPGEPGAGNAYVVGLLTPRVVVYDSTGTFVQAHDILPAGSVPRAIHIDTSNDRLSVYCWGNNEILTFTLSNLAAAPLVSSLGFDPTPADVQEGRRIFYDGSHSAHGDESCATCHVEGRMDQVAWDLSNRPIDDKGPLVTQTLSGIERMRPFHWRGEQMKGLIDFNGAFDSLLGGSMLSASDFEKLEKFIFSIQSPANPTMDPTRIINNAFSPPIPAVVPPGFSANPGDAVNGQHFWFDIPTVGTATCNDCHTLPIGTNGDIIGDGGVDLHQKRSRLMVTGFNAMWRKTQDPVLVTLHEFDALGNPTGNQVTRRYPTLGHGFAHSGAAANLIEFTRGGGGLTNQQVADIAAFLEMLDTGIAPAVHRAYLYDLAHLAAANDITGYLLPEAAKGNCDVVVFGTSTFGQPATVRWVYDPITQIFQSEFLPLTRDFSFFQTQAQLGTGANIFMGVPKGMGERFAIDFDSDGLFNITESRSWGTQPLDPDTDGDTFEDGHEVDNGSIPTNAGSTPNDTTAPTVSNLSIEWINTRNVKINFDTDEPTTYAIDLSTALHTLPTVTGPDAPRRAHGVAVNGLLPSTNPDPPGPTHSYSGTLTVIDRGGNSTVVNLTQIDPLPFTRNATNDTVVLSDLDWVPPIAFAIGGGAIAANATATIQTKFQVPNSPPVQDVVLVARVLVLRAGQDIPEVSSTFTSSLKFTTFTQPLGGSGVMGPAEFYEGPFLMSTASNANGVASFSFGQGGLNSGDKVILVIDGASGVPVNYPTAPIDFPDSISRWSLPDTPAQFRSIEITIP
ncbi:MAG: hypothetical protein KDC38_01255 [Planctomycetes bacterium]|nr:hypothetical protein [Planctomycetota bacterium]